jgi:hypothetical protein
MENLMTTLDWQSPDGIWMPIAWEFIPMADPAVMRFATEEDE